MPGRRNCFSDKGFAIGKGRPSLKIRWRLLLAVLCLFTGCADSGNRHVYIPEEPDTFRTAAEHSDIAGEAGLSALAEDSPLYEEYRGCYPEFFEKKS